MKFIKEEKVPFAFSMPKLNDYKPGEYSLVYTLNDKLLVKTMVSNEDGYAYDEISWYDLEDLSKPQHTQQIKRLPNFPKMNALTYKKYLNGFYRFNESETFFSDDRVAFLFSTDFDNLGGVEKTGSHHNLWGVDYLC